MTAADGCYPSLVNPFSGGHCARLSFAGTLLMLLTGCGKPAAELPALGTVQGIVTLDGNPLEKASVFFVPAGRDGGSSNAVTDATGRYELHYDAKHSGAVLGTHRVEIRTGGEGYDKEGNFFETAEKLPAIYHSRSRLTAEVAAGANEINFELKGR
jgi:hypothetical protein